jgi:hypothetical protein
MFTSKFLTDIVKGQLKRYEQTRDWILDVSPLLGKSLYIEGELKNLKDQTGPVISIRIQLATYQLIRGPTNPRNTEVVLHFYDEYHSKWSQAYHLGFRGELDVLINFENRTDIHEMIKAYNQFCIVVHTKEVFTRVDWATITTEYI